MASRNPFALLAGEGGDDSDHEQQTLSKQSKPATAASSGVAKPAQAQATQRRTVPGQTASRPQKETKELPTSADAPGFEGERGRDDRGTGFQRGGRGGRGRGERGSGRGRGAARNARPDRRSATGITDSDKKEHQGWGGDDGKRELEAETAAATDAAAEKDAAANGEAPVVAAADGESADKPAADAAAAAPAAPVEEEDNSKSYEEYLAERKAAGRGILENLTGASGRKANEGSDDSQWKDGVLLEKSEGDAYFVGQQKEKTVKQKQRKEKNLLEVEFAAPPRTDSGRGEGTRGGRGRGERGSGRGGPRGAGRGRGAAGGASRGSGAGPRGGRGGANGANAVNVDDSAAFPSLS